MKDRRGAFHDYLDPDDDMASTTAFIEAIPDADPASDPAAAYFSEEAQPEPSQVAGIELRALVEALPRLQRLIISWRYGVGDPDAMADAPLPVAVIASRLGVTRQSVYNLERQALRLLCDWCEIVVSHADLPQSLSKPDEAA